LRRRQAIEPAIGHMKLDNRMRRCWLGDPAGDALHAVLCATGYNLRWLMRAVLRGRIRPFFAALIAWWAALVHSARPKPGWPEPTAAIAMPH
jgi:IS5 family transposase